MSELKYDPTADSFFNVFQDVGPVKSNRTMHMPLGDIELPEGWYVNDNGIPMKGEEEPETTPQGGTMINDNNPELVTKLVQNPFKSKNEWATALANAYRKLGVSENGIKNLIAKNALESGWGKHIQGQFNYGNITTGSSWKGKYVNGRDHDAKGNPIRSKFRSYNSLEEFAQDEINFLTRLYDFNDSDSIDTFLEKLQGNNKGKRRYAEAPTYKNRVKSVYNSL